MHPILYFKCHQTNFFQRKLSLLDPNVPVVRNVSKTFLNSDGQENHSRKRKQPECDEAVAKKILVTSAQSDCSPAPHGRANVIDTRLSKPNDFEVKLIIITRVYYENWL